MVPYVHNLYRHLAARDLAVVQGGLTTSMELTAQKRPFLYFPLRHHFEQNFHVRHRLERYGAGRRMDFDESPPELIAAAIAEEIGRDVNYRDVEGRRRRERPAASPNSSSKPTPGLELEESVASWFRFRPLSHRGERPFGSVVGS